MKYLKKFESSDDYNTDKKFWKIPTDPIRYKYAIKKLGLDDQNIDYWLNCDYSDKGEYIYLSRYMSGKNKKHHFGWVKFNYTGYDFYIAREYEYMGELEIPKELVSQEKYNL